MCLLSSLPQVLVHSILLKVNSALCVVIVTAFLTTTVNLMVALVLPVIALWANHMQPLWCLKLFVVSGFLLSQAITNFAKLLSDSIVVIPLVIAYMHTCWERVQYYSTCLQFWTSNTGMHLLKHITLCQTLCKWDIISHVPHVSCTVMEENKVLMSFWDGYRFCVFWIRKVGAAAAAAAAAAVATSAVWS